ncbi:MAG: TetR/AcrR family transcriptional regulator [Gordonia sp. (in: high G+C Gram-positive bacteria)]
MPKIVAHDERRRELADAALALAARKGVGSVTTRAVAEEAGWSIGVLNHYFDSRRDLMRAALLRARELQDHAYREILADPTTSAHRKLELLTDCVLPLDDRRLALTRVFLFFYAEGTASDDARAAVATLLASWRAMIAEQLGAAAAAGEVPADLDIQLAATHLTALTDGLALEAVLDPAVMARLHTPGAVARIVATVAPRSAA